MLESAARAAGNAWSHYVRGGVEPYVPTPSRIVHDEPHAVLRRYDALDVTGDPILLVPPLAVHITCFDLRPNQSLAQHLVATGRPVYVVDFGEIGFADRRMGFEDWLDRILPATLRRVSARHGGRPVDVETAPGSHLGVLSGPAARRTTWVQITEFLDEVAAPSRPSGSGVPELLDRRLDDRERVR